MSLSLAALLALAIVAALLVRFTEPGGLFRVPIIVRGLRYHVTAQGRHVRRPDPLATIPDALTIARTA